jgi:hypothetical protein
MLAYLGVEQRVTQASYNTSCCESILQSERIL